MIGMCLTGAVAAQPSLPFSFSKPGQQDLGLNAIDLQAAAAATTPVLTLRYGRDVICPAQPRHAHRPVPQQQVG
jgi:hypothetical protein